MGFIRVNIVEFDSLLLQLASLCAGWAVQHPTFSEYHRSCLVFSQQSIELAYESRNFKLQDRAVVVPKLRLTRARAFLGVAQNRLLQFPERLRNLLDSSVQAWSDAYKVRGMAEEMYQKAAEVVSGTRPRDRRVGDGSGPIEREETAQTAFGRGRVGVDTRKYRYDVHRGQATKVSFNVTRDDRMSAVEAGETLHALHRMFGIDSENEDRLAAFDKALWFYHTVNSASVLQPGRGVIEIDGQDFDFSLVRDKLGTNLRRFFRAFADDITETNRQVIDSYDPYDPVSAEQHGWLMQVAAERGLHRYPHLAHDSADACVRISHAERMAVAASKRLVLGSTVNSADRGNVSSRAVTIEGYDSTVGDYAVKK